MSTECSRETSLRLTISQAVFFLQFCALPFFDILTRRTKDTDVYSIHHHPILFFRSIEYTMWRFYEGKKWQDWQAVDSVQILTWKSSIKGQKKTLSRWFCFTIYSFQFDRIIEVNFYQMQSFITITVLMGFVSKNLTWMQCVLKQNIAEMSLDTS